jgi:curved DNA-binding protein CbpA
MPNYAAGSLPLQNAAIYIATHVTDRENVLELATVERQYHLAFKNEQKLEEWMFALCNAGVTLKTPIMPDPEAPPVPFRRKLGIHGWLSKRGSWNKSFKKRFFRTMETASGRKVIAYFGSMASPDPKGVIPLDGAVLQNSDEDNATDADFIIKTTKGRNFVLRAENAATKNSWETVINAMLDGSADAIFAAKEIEAKQLGQMTYYELLEVEEDAVTSQIITQYRTLAKQFHPDRNHTDDAKERFPLINEAYRVLATTSTRREYDYNLCMTRGEKWIEKEYKDGDHDSANSADAGSNQLDVPASTPVLGSSPAKASATGNTIPGVGLLGGPDNDASAFDEASSSDIAAAAASASGAAGRGSVSQLDSTRSARRGRTAASFLSDESNYCKNCQGRIKALYCVLCKKDYCLGCSTTVHNTPELRLHVRVVTNKKKDFLAGLADPESKPYQRMVRYEDDLNALIQSQADAKAQAEKDAADAALQAAAGGGIGTSSDEDDAAADTAAVSAEDAKATDATPEPQSEATDSTTEVVAAAAAVSAAVTTAVAVVPNASPGVSAEQAEAMEQQRVADSIAEDEKQAHKDAVKAALEKLHGGLSMDKVPHYGSPKATNFYLENSSDKGWLFRWESKKKKESETTIAVSAAVVLNGQQTKLFKKHASALKEKAGLSFSLDGRKRTVDVVCHNKEDYDTWMLALRHIGASFQ